MPELEKEYIDGLINLFRNVVIFLDEKEIKYWICSGTILGCVREKGQIKHDDDVDIAMFEPDLEKFLEYAEELATKHDLLITAHGGMIKIANQHIYRMSDKIEDARLAITVDILLYEQFDDRIQLALEQHRELWENSYHLIDDFEPFQKIQYEDFEVDCVKNPIPYLERCYGDDWMTPKDIISDTHTH